MLGATRKKNKQTGDQAVIRDLRDDGGLTVSGQRSAGLSWSKDLEMSD